MKSAEQIVCRCLAGFGTGRITPAIKEQAEEIRKSLADEGYVVGTERPAGYVTNGAYINLIRIENRWEKDE